MQKTAQWAFLGLGFLMAGSGAAVKFWEVLQSPGLFQFVFFSGSAYILMICGLTLMIIALGHELLFA